MVYIRNIFEHTTPADIHMLCELPYPVFNDIIMKQIEENKKQKQKLDNMKNKTVKMRPAPKKRKR